MKNFVFKTCFILTVFVLLDSPLLAESVLRAKLIPAQDNRLILQQYCERGEPIVLSEKASSGIDNLKKGDEVWLFTEGGLFSALLGDLSCFGGTCGGNYVSAEIENYSEVWTIYGAVKKASIDRHTITMSPKLLNEMEGFPNCDDMFSEFGNETYYMFKEEKNSRSCLIYSIDRNNKYFLQAAQKKYVGEDVYSYKSMSRFLANDNNSINKGKMFHSNMGKVFISLMTENQPIKIIWRDQQGACCPSEISLTIGEVDTKDGLKNRRTYYAGGQPCD